MSDLSGVEWLAGFGHSPLRHSPLGPLPCYAYGEHSYLNNNTNGDNNNTRGNVNNTNGDSNNTNVDNNNKTKKYDAKSKEGKPACSYASLIRLAISSKPNGKMTLSELYAYIEQTFPYFQDAGLGWRNSIRHNLSLNKCFVKVARGNDDPGKGSYWTMDLNHQDDQPTKKRKRAIRTSPYSPECSSNSSGDQARSAEPSSAQSSAITEVKKQIKEEFEGGGVTVKEEPPEEECAGAARRGGEAEVLSVLELMEDEYDVDSNSGCGSAVRARRHVCGAERHAAYTDDYGNFIERVVDDCDCPDATDDNDHTGHAPSHNVTPSTTASSYGSFSSSSDLCSPLHSEVGFFDKDLPTTPDTYREFTYETRAHADYAYANCQNYAHPPYAQDSHVCTYWGPQIL